MILKLLKCNPLIIISYLLFILILVSLYQYLNVQDNKCLMTFMYATPNFIPIPLPKKVENNFKNYKIYAYKEGKKDDKFDYSDFNGFPVLFIPGSSGSHKQVRSFASISMNFNRHYITKRHLDFFAIDFNEQLSGVYGPYLQNQTIFLNQAIKIIKRLYHHKQKNKEVKLIVIAHSFGGIIFKGLINLPSFKIEDVILLLTLATPHQKSVFPFDSSFHTYYSSIEKNSLNYEKYKQIAKISIGGGLNDNLVRSDLTNEIESNQWSLTSNSLPEVWVKADHKCIVWCKQLVKKLVHLIYDLLEERSNDKQLINRNTIIDHHLNHRSNDRITPRYTQLPAILNTNGKLNEIEKRLFIFDKPKLIDTQLYEFKFISNTFYSIVSTNLYKLDWIFVCKSNDDLNDCVKLTNLTNQAIPSAGEFNGLIKRNHFIIDSDTNLSNGYTRLLLQISPSLVRTRFQIERIIHNRRNKEFELPGIFSRLFWALFPFRTILKISIGEESTFYNLTINNFNQIWHNYNLRLEIGRCYEEAKEDLVLNLNVPWYKENRYHLIETKKENQFNTVLNLNVPKYNLEDESKPNIQLILDPYCEYRLKIKFSFRETIIQLFRHYSFLFLPITSSILLIAYSIQLNSKQYQNELSNEKIDYYQNLKSILINNINQVTFYGLMPSIPFLMDKLITTIAFKFGFEKYLESNLIFINYTNHDSHIYQLFLNYLIYSFVYFNVFIMTHFFTFFFSLIISHLSYLNKTQLLLQYKNHLLSLYSSKYHLQKYTNSKPILLVIFLFLIYLKLIAYILIAIYLIRILNISIQNYLNQQKIGLNRSTSRIHLEISKFLLVLFSFLPLVPKFVVWFTTNEFIFDKTTILFKITFLISLTQLCFLNINHDLLIKKNTLLSLLINFVAIICLCFAHLDYTVITISLNFIIILRSLNEFKMNHRNDQLDKKLTSE